MIPKKKRPRHRKETEFIGEVQTFTLRMRTAEDPPLGPRDFRGRPPNPYFQGDKGKKNPKKKK